LKKPFALILSAAILLSACGATERDSEYPEKESESESAVSSASTASSAEVSKPDIINPYTDEWEFSRCSDDCPICSEAEKDLDKYGATNAWLNALCNLPVAGETIEELNEKAEKCGNITEIFVFRTPWDETGIPVSEGVLENGMFIKIVYNENSYITFALESNEPLYEYTDEDFELQALIGENIEAAQNLVYYFFGCVNTDDKADDRFINLNIPSVGYEVTYVLASAETGSNMEPGFTSVEEMKTAFHKYFSNEAAERLISYYISYAVLGKDGSVSGWDNPYPPKFIEFNGRVYRIGSEGKGGGFWPVWDTARIVSKTDGVIVFVLLAYDPGWVGEEFIDKAYTSYGKLVREDGVWKFGWDVTEAVSEAF